MSQLNTGYRMVEIILQVSVGIGTSIFRYSGNNEKCNITAPRASRFISKFNKHQICFDIFLNIRFGSIAYVYF